MKKPRAVNNRHKALQQFLKSRRAIEVADLYAAGKTQMQIAKMLGVSQTAVFENLRALREQWRARAGETIAVWREQEIAYTTKMRLDAEVLWRRTNNPTIGGLVIQWSRRLDALMGLEAPKKYEKTDTKTWLEGIEQDKIEKSEVLTEANKIVADELARLKNAG